MALVDAAGVIAIDCKVAALTVNVAVLEVTLPSTALILLVPAATAVARPVLAPMVAVAAVAELQVTEVVMS